MACKTKKARKEASKAAQKVQKNAGDKLHQSADKASEFAGEWAAKLQERAGQANEWAQKEVAPRVQEQIDKATPAVEQAVSSARAKASVAAAGLAEKLDSAEAPPQVKTAVAKLTGDKKALKKAQKQAAQAAKDFAKEQKKANKKSHKGLLVFGILAAATVAGVAAWRASRPVEDPWQTPADPKPAPAARTAAQDDASGPAGKEDLAEQKVTKPANAPAPSNEEVTDHADPKNSGHPAPGSAMNKPASAYTANRKGEDTVKPEVRRKDDGEEPANKDKNT